MKNSIWVLFFVGAILLLLPFESQAQEVAQAGVGFFSKILSFGKEQIIGVFIGIVTAWLGRKGWLAAIKMFAKKTSEISIQLSEAFGALGIASGKLDQAIHDDNTVDQNTLNEAFEAGKDVIVETNDVVMVFKPKPANP